MNAKFSVGQAVKWHEHVLIVEAVDATTPSWIVYWFDGREYDIGRELPRHFGLPEFILEAA